MKAGTVSATEYRSRARQLLKQLRSDDSTVASAAAARFLRLRSFVDRSVRQLLENRDRVRLKHALAVVALAHGYDSWVALKAASEHPDASAELESRPLDASTLMHTRRMETLLNRWFATYEEARASLEHQEGFLLPYGSQFFVCESEGIRELGLDPSDPDWERIGWDWVKPLDRDAWERLSQKRRRVLADSHSATPKSVG